MKNCILKVKLPVIIEKLLDCFKIDCSRPWQITFPKVLTFKGSIQWTNNLLLIGNIFSSSAYGTENENKLSSSA